MGNELNRQMDSHPRNVNGDPVCCSCRNYMDQSISLIQLECGHHHCTNCLKDSIHEFCIVKNKSFLNVPCGFSYCRCPLSLEQVRQIANQDVLYIIDNIIENTIPKEKKESYTLEELGYFYDSELRLRMIKDPSKSFYYISERYYDALGNAIVEYIHKQMEDKYNFEKRYVNSRKENYVMVTKDYMEKENLMILCPGSGAVRAGQWARALCINDSLHTGSMLDYIDQAQDEEYGVIVLNPNQNVIAPQEDINERCDFLNPSHSKIFRGEPIENSSSGGEHFIWAWDNLVMKSKNVKSVSIVAHSAGGYHTLELLRERKDEVNQLVTGIGFTDSVHSLTRHDMHFGAQFLYNTAVNWVTSKKSINTIVREPGSHVACECRSAGTVEHELTSAYCQPYLFEFLADMRKYFENEGEYQSNEYPVS